MRNLILFDTEAREHLLPLTYTRPICELRLGILTIREKWEKWLQGRASHITMDYLSEKFSMEIADLNYVINGAALPSPQLVRLITQLEPNEALLDKGELIAALLDRSQFSRLMANEDIDELAGMELENTVFDRIASIADLLRLQEPALRSDFEILTRGRQSQPIPSSNRVVAPENIFLEPGATVEGATLNAFSGPIYVAAGAEIMEGALIRGGLALCENSMVKMGAKIYGATTVGPWSKIGGEVSHSVFQGYSNKAHDGYLGDSFIGEWCNLGAGTNNSNLKNTYEEVRLWNYATGRFEQTGLQFLGLIMGDHSKTAINTMFNTGTVVGVSSNIFGSGFPRNFIPSFCWGGAQGYSTYRAEKAFDTAERVMARRKLPFSIQDRLILLRVFEDSAKYRNWESKS